MIKCNQVKIKLNITPITFYNKQPHGLCVTLSWQELHNQDDLYKHNKRSGLCPTPEFIWGLWMQDYISTSKICATLVDTPTHKEASVDQLYYEGRPINKLQNGIILLIFKI